MSKAAKFFSGRPCKRGHMSERLVSSGACCECQKQLNDAIYSLRREAIVKQVAAYRVANPEKVKAVRKRYIAENSDAVKTRDRQRFVGARRENAVARLRAWNEANPERMKLRVEAWAKANPGKRNASTAKYRAQRLQATAPWADHDLINSMYELARIYNDYTPLDVHVDHEIPLQGKKVCGLHVHNNLQIIDAYRNRAKSNHFTV